LPVAPRNSIRQIVAITEADATAGRLCAAATMPGTPDCPVTKSSVPKYWKIMNMPIRTPTSPIRFMINAFFAASPADFFS